MAKSVVAPILAVGGLAVAGFLAYRYIQNMDDTSGFTSGVTGSYIPEPAPRVILTDIRQAGRDTRTLARQDARTDRTVARGDTRVQKTEAVQSGRTTRTVARQDNKTDRTQIRWTGIENLQSNAIDAAKQSVVVASQTAKNAASKAASVVKKAASYSPPAMIFKGFKQAYSRLKNLRS